jgi:type VI secretion system protein ImpH
MEAQTGTASDVLDSFRDLIASPVGAVLLQLVSQRIHARNDTGEMPTLLRSKRTFEEVEQLLAEDASSLNLFAVMRLLDAVSEDVPRLGTARRIREERIRFGQEVTLAFAPGELARYEPGVENTVPRLMQHSFGLFGPNGPLPTHLTEYAFGRLHHNRDETFARFADIFHHRLLTLMYRAWALAQPVVGLDRPGETHFTDQLASLMGLGLSKLRSRDGVPDNFKFAHAGLFARQTRHPEGMAALLENYFRVPIRILTWVGYWLRVPSDQQTSLSESGGFARLGVETSLGESVWDAQTGFRIIVGPLPHKRYLDFLPNGLSLPRLMDLVRLYVGDEYRFDVQLVLQEKEVPFSWLGNDVLLGWTSWLGVRLEPTDANDYIAAAGEMEALNSV